ncbi:hypothetical protein JW948_12295 [bacterium]|nr:hypothetical protein [bacterium]
MKRKSLILAGLFLLGLTGTVAAQSAHDVVFDYVAFAVMRVYDAGTDVTIDIDSGVITTPGESGAGATADGDITKYLQYTSFTSGTAVAISATRGALPTGVTALSVDPTVCSTGAGTHGSEAAGGYIAIPTGSSTNIITGIGSAYTGIGATDGAAMVYRATFDLASLLWAEDGSSVTVTYSIAGY